jgi:hypothetical protein
MMGTGKRCKEKFALRYVDGLVPARTSRSPSFGSLFHLLAQAWWAAHPALKPDQIWTAVGAVEAWRNDRIRAAEEHAAQIKAQLGIDDASLVTQVEEQCRTIATDCLELFDYFRKQVLEPERDQYVPLFIEQNFNVPLPSRDGRRHPVWRFRGKYDLVLQDLGNMETVLRDYKTTVRQPTDMATMLELDTQPVGYVYAALYLATSWDRGGHALAGDEPTWPREASAPRGFELEVIRKKVPREPPLLKKGGLSKAQNVDTTPDLYEKAIQRHGLDRSHYEDVINRLHRRGPAFYYRHRVAVGPREIRRWAHETRLLLEDLRRIELHRDAAYRADPMTCQNQYGRRCVYHELCFGDADIARADFVVRPVHEELIDAPAQEEDEG